MTHALDLSRWLTQPCIIIIGQMPGGAPSPTPIYVDDQAISTKGHTVVRWIYPLPADPPGL
ncbi:MAG: hypothetical protein H7Y88_04920 [Phycisphaerales bacterium]|nr:hypothetical protein [Phycisphaerales bacterium]